MTNDAGSGFDNQAAGRDAGANLDEIEEESRHLAGDEDPEEDQERKHSQDNINDVFG